MGISSGSGTRGTASSASLIAPSHGVGGVHAVLVAVLAVAVELRAEGFEFIGDPETSARRSSRRIRSRSVSDPAISSTPQIEFVTVPTQGYAAVRGNHAANANPRVATRRPANVGGGSALRSVPLSVGSCVSFVRLSVRSRVAIEIRVESCRRWFTPTRRPDVARAKCHGFVHPSTRLRSVSRRYRSCSRPFPDASIQPRPRPRNPGWLASSTYTV